MLMTDAESVARGILDICEGMHIESLSEHGKQVIDKIATVLRDRYDAGYADACRIVHDRADAEGYRRGVEEAANFCFFQYEWHMKHERYCCAKTAKECKEGIRKQQRDQGALND